MCLFHVDESCLFFLLIDLSFTEFSFSILFVSVWLVSCSPIYSCFVNRLSEINAKERYYFVLHIHNSIFLHITFPFFVFSIVGFSRTFLMNHVFYWTIDCEILVFKNDRITMINSSMLKGPKGVKDGSFDIE